MVYRCPVCQGTVFYTVAGEADVRRETGLRDRFVQARLPYRPEAAELKDLTDFMHDAPAPLFACGQCNTVVREEEESRDESTYGEDENGPDFMAQVFPRYAEAFRAKAAAYRDYLRPGAEVLEIGPHLGAFLQVAEEWNWRPTGLDVGRDTLEFMRKSGFRVCSGVIEERCYSASTYDGVFIWNCFEQIPDPKCTLAAVHCVLRSGGLLVIRVPNIDAYRFLRDMRRSAFRSQALAYNNLLGFPYLYGYNIHSLTRLLEGNGFRFVRAFNSELVTTPFADPSERVTREQKDISRRVSQWSSRLTRERGLLLGPWIEAVFRRVDESHRDPKVPLQKLDARFLPRAA